MKDELIALLLAYLLDKVGLDAIDDWIGANVRNASADAKVLLDEVSVQLAYLDDGYSDEEYFRAQMAQVLYPASVIKIGYGARETIGLGGEGIDLGFVYHFPRSPHRGLEEVITVPASEHSNLYSPLFSGR